MLAPQHRRQPGAVVVILSLAILCGTSSSSAAQEKEQSSFLAYVAKGVVLDPTTYAPAAISYHATMMDWKTSQPFFQHGFYEGNPGFTISGLPNDVAVGYDEGSRRILIDSLKTLQTSVAYNISSRLIERTLMDHYPEHRKLIRTIGWIERTALASYMSYTLSEAHYRQWRGNERLAQQMGY